MRWWRGKIQDDDLMVIEVPQPTRPDPGIPEKRGILPPPYGNSKRLVRRPPGMRR